MPLEPGQRALAVHVEDHPLDYATFEGEIPKGEYGAGTVEIWDSGTYELVEEKKDGGLTVRLDGTRLQGLWTLIPAKLDGNPKNWLLIRKRDDAQNAEGDGRARRRYEPMLATLDENVPKGDGWLFEVKWDGYRALAYLRGGEVRLVSRNGNDLTERFRGRRERDSAKPLKTPDCVLDGEVCALDEDGRPSFSAMQQGKPGTPIVYEAFDLLEVDGRAARRPSAARAARHGSSSCSTAGTRRSGSPRRSRTATRCTRRPGSSASRGSSPSGPTRRTGRARRTREWLKIKTHGRQEFVIAGYTKGQGRRSGRFGSLVLGVLARRRARLRRQRRHRLHRQGDRRAAREAAAARTEGEPVPLSSRRCRRCARRTWSG